MSDLLQLSAVDARAALDAKEITATELTQSYLDAAVQTEALNNYVQLTHEKALEMAAASDARLQAGTAGPLEGIPVGVKDLFCTEGVETTACSAILKGFVPPYESTVTSKLWADGAARGPDGHKCASKLRLALLSVGAEGEAAYGDG